MHEQVINPIAAEIGERIRLYREQHGLSQKQMAEAIGISPPRLCHHEKGTEMPGLVVLARISKFMQCSLDYLYYGRVEDVVGKIDPLLRAPFIELQDFSEETRRAVHESAYAHMSREIVQRRGRQNPDTGIIPGKPPKNGKNDS